MKILLLSDTHGQDEIVFDLVKMYPNMDLYLHAGDSLSDEYFIHPFISVKGNCDQYPFSELYRVFTPIGYLLMKHLPYFDAKSVNDNTILIHGHTHKVKVNIDGEDYVVSISKTNWESDSNNPDDIQLLLDFYDYLLQFNELNNLTPVEV